MKKLLLVVFAALVLFWVGTLVLIPNPLALSAVGFIKAPAAKVNGIMLDTVNWYKWQPASAGKYRYTVLSKTILTTRFFAQSGSDTFTSELTVLPALPDSTVLQWTALQPVSSNPFIRIRQYNRAANIQKQLQLLLDSLTAYVQNREKMYGLDIVSTRFTNPFMLNTKMEFNHYPTTDEVYRVVDKLRAYAKENAVAAVDSPMVNIQQMDDQYLLRTALPIDKKLPTFDNIDFKQMVLGKTLFGTVTGNQQQVEQALHGMQEFINDYRMSSPAIPFQVWQTNRQQQPDSSRWITRLYYPVF